MSIPKQAILQSDKTEVAYLRHQEASPGLSPFLYPLMEQQQQQHAIAATAKTGLLNPSESVNTTTTTHTVLDTESGPPVAPPLPQYNTQKADTEPYVKSDRRTLKFEWDSHGFFRDLVLNAASHLAWDQVGPVEAYLLGE